jgi:hypothetical protein
VDLDTRGSSLQPRWHGVRHDVDVVAGSREVKGELARDDPGAAVGRIAEDPDAHGRSLGC